MYEFFDGKNGNSLFLIILVGAIGAALVGGCFAAIIGLLAPDFVNNLFGEFQEGCLTSALCGGSGNDLGAVYWSGSGKFFSLVLVLSSASLN